MLEKLSSFQEFGASEEVKRKIFDNIRRVKDEVFESCVKVGRNPDEIKIVAVSKTFPSFFIRFAYEAGIDKFGENYVQEALRKKQELQDIKISWHFIGHLQSNKAKFIPGNFDFIHSVDSLELLRELEKRCEKSGAKIKALVQVNISEEKTKYGIHPDDVFRFFSEVQEKINLLYVEVVGMMVIPSPPKDQEDSRKYFRKLMKIREECIKRGISETLLREVSMGMSDDFKVAVEEGATILRIGRAIFFEREKKKTYL
ncbi:hypothetical protein HRbin19_01558 [bacterium HR19]|nr:hypothetical protein HRbin19_01558 [bacterium HR19]